MSCSRFPGRSAMALSVVVILSAFAGSASANVMSDATLWLKADSGVTTDGSGGISEWADQSSTGTLAEQYYTASKRPLYVSSAVNGKPVVRYDGTDDLMTVDTNAPTIGQGLPGSGFTVFTVYQDTGSSNVGWSPVFEKASNVGGDGTSNIDYSIARSGGDLYWVTGSASGGGSAILGATAPALNTFHVVAADLSSAGGENGSKDLWIDGVLAASGTYTHKAAASLEPLVLGRQDNNSSALLQGDMAELVIFNRTLTAGELNDVGYYLAQKYDIATSYVPEPGSLMLTAIGLIGLLAYARRVRR
jgi:hypothetical protein